MGHYSLDKQYEAVKWFNLSVFLDDYMTWNERFAYFLGILGTFLGCLFLGEDNAWIPT